MRPAGAGGPGGRPEGVRHLGQPAGLDLTEEGGLLVQSSCSSRIPADEFFAAVHLGADSSRHRISEILRSTHAPDHPIGFPEGAYLKTIFARVHKRAEFGKR